jgi:hypothetical protein
MEWLSGLQKKSWTHKKNSHNKISTQVCIYKTNQWGKFYELFAEKLSNLTQITATYLGSR